MEPTTKIWTVCEQTYFPSRLKIRHPHTKEQYRYAVKNFGQFLAREATVGDLTDENILGMMRMLLDKGLAPRTVNERRGRINAVWRWLAQRGHFEKWPTVEKVPEAESIPLSWTEEQLQRLFAACACQEHPIGCVPGNLWWTALHAWLWNTSERIGATLRLRWDHLDLHEGVATVPASVRKGSLKWATYTLWPETIAAIACIAEPTRSLVFEWPYHRSYFWNRYAKLLNVAGLPNNRKTKAHAMRVSHATWVRVLSGQAARNLGHANQATTERHYEDPRICRADAPTLFIPWKRTG